ncbi:MAG: hypothetical protein ABH803_00295 [Candidatus Micrarchaeota archaeon]
MILSPILTEKMKWVRTGVKDAEIRGHDKLASDVINQLLIFHQDFFPDRRDERIKFSKNGVSVERAKAILASYDNARFLEIIKVLESELQKPGKKLGLFPNHKEHLFDLYREIVPNVETQDSEVTKQIASLKLDEKIAKMLVNEGKRLFK